jgi:hypothetical protein
MLCTGATAERMGKHMKSYHFNTVVEADGTIRISGLPPQQEVEIIVLERTGLPEEMQNWLDDIRARHPFAKMSKEEILQTLRQTRETVWAERHES